MSLVVSPEFSSHFKTSCPFVFGFPNTKHTLLPRSVAKRLPTFYAPRLVSVTRSQAERGLKVASPCKGHLWMIPCTLLGAYNQISGVPRCPKCRMGAVNQWGMC